MLEGSWIWVCQEDEEYLHYIGHIFEAWEEVLVRTHLSLLYEGEVPTTIRLVW